MKMLSKWSQTQFPKGKICVDLKEIKWLLRDKNVYHGFSQIKSLIRTDLFLIFTVFVALF